jgi:superfamily II helicase
MPFKTGNWGKQAQTRSEKRKKYFRDYQKKRYIEFKETINEYKKQWRLKNPEKVQAHLLSNNIKIPIDQLCATCKKEKATQRHHPDYSKPFNIEFLCCSCHRKTMNKR